MDGVRLVGPFDRIQIGRRVTQESSGSGAEKVGLLLLPLDTTVSSRHAHLERQGGIWYLAEDPKNPSANGTFLAGRAIRQPTPIGDGAEFVVGASVVRFHLGANEPAFLPGVSELLGQSARFRARLSPDAAVAFGLAWGFALEQKRNHVSDRDLFLALAMTRPDPTLFDPKSGLLTPSLLTETVRKGVYWSGDRDWITRLLFDASPDPDLFFSDEVVPTPRVVEILIEAEKRAGGRESREIGSLDLLEAFLLNRKNKPRELLERAGIDVGRILGVVEIAIQARGPASAPPDRRLAGPESPSGGFAFDPRTRDLSRELCRVGAEFQLAEPSDRHRAIRDRLSEILGPLPKEQRRTTLAELRHFFPVQSGETGSVAKILELQRRVEQAEASKRALEEENGSLRTKASSPTAGSIVDWSQILDSRSKRSAPPPRRPTRESPTSASSTTSRPRSSASWSASSATSARGSPEAQSGGFPDTGASSGRSTTTFSRDNRWTFPSSKSTWAPSSRGSSRP
jgi:hypothetical protein